MNDWKWMTRFNPGLVGNALILLLILALATPAMGLIEVGTGNSPIQDDHWPAGSVDVANLKSRVGWWEGPPFGGGEHCFLYRGDAAAFQQALDTFVRIKTPKLQLIIHDGGPVESEFLKDSSDPKADIHYDWSFTVWNPQNWNQLYNNPSSQFEAQDPDHFREAVAPPTVDLYVGGGKGIDFSKVNVPAGVSVTDERADANGFTGGSVVIGDLFDTTTSKPLAGAKVAISHEKAYNEWEQVAFCATDASGHFELRTSLKGNFGVIGSAEGYAPRVLGRDELRGNTLLRFTSQLSPAATLMGVVIDTEGKPVMGATVHIDSVTGVDGHGYLVPGQNETKSDAQGKFQMTGLPKDGHALVFSNADHYSQLDVLKLHSIPEDDVVVRLTATGEIKGRVVDKAGKPAGNGNVDIEPAVKPRERIGMWGGGSNTAADGSFHFENVPPGQYIVSAMATNPGPAFQGSDPNAKTITVKAGETVSVEVRGR